MGLRALNSEGTTNSLVTSPGHSPSHTPASFSSSARGCTHQFGEVNFRQKEVGGFQPEVQVRLLRAEEEQEPEVRRAPGPRRLLPLPGMGLPPFSPAPALRSGWPSQPEFSFSPLGAPGHRPTGEGGMAKSTGRQERGTRDSPPFGGSQGVSGKHVPQLLDGRTLAGADILLGDGAHKRPVLQQAPLCRERRVEVARDLTTPPGVALGSAAHLVPALPGVSANKI